jgi:hypothetical protein
MQEGVDYGSEAPGVFRGFFMFAQEISNGARGSRIAGLKARKHNVLLRMVTEVGIIQKILGDPANDVVVRVLGALENPDLPLKRSEKPRNVSMIHLQILDRNCHETANFRLD